MKILFLQIIVNLFIISNALRAQCTVQQTVGTGASGPNYNNSEGQSATACEAGGVTTIAFYVVVITDQPLARIELYEGNSYSNLVRTVNNYVPNIGWNYINIDAGTGPAYSLDDNEMFRFRIWNISTTGFFPYTRSLDNPYPNGTRIHHTGSQSASLDLVFKFAMNNAPLPIELSAIKVHNNKGQNILTFTTASEINNAGFDIERSSDGIDFQKIGWVEGHGSTTEEKQYSFTDTRPWLGLNYYRLRQMDYDGRFEYSKIVSIMMKSDDVTIFPNPASDILHIQNTTSGSYLIKSILGTIITQGVLTDDSRIDISNLPSGTYLFYPDSGKPQIFNKL